MTAVGGKETQAARQEGFMVHRHERHSPSARCHPTVAEQSTRSVNSTCRRLYCCGGRWGTVLQTTSPLHRSGVLGPGPEEMFATADRTVQQGSGMPNETDGLTRLFVRTPPCCLPPRGVRTISLLAPQRKGSPEGAPAAASWRPDRPWDGGAHEGQRWQVSWQVGAASARADVTGHV